MFLAVIIIYNQANLTPKITITDNKNHKLFNSNSLMVSVRGW